MKYQIRKTKRQLKRRTEKFVERVIFLFKTSLLVLFLFLLVFFYVVKPTWETNKVNIEDFSSVRWREESVETQFIDSMAPYAKKAQEAYGVRPSVLIAQAALESSWGESTLSQETNNYFGIKASKNGEEYSTKEFTDETWIEIDASFRRYASVEDSVMDYAKLLNQGTNWNSALYHGVLQAPTYKEAAIEIQRAGYATDPNYSDKVIQIIEQYHLYELDSK